jgi:hypothetical protein
MLVYETVSCPTPQSGMTSRPSTGDRGLDWWMSCLPGSLANRGVSLANSEANLTNAISGRTLSALFARFDPATHSWKMCPASKRNRTLASSSLTWPRAGMVCDGLAYQLPHVERRTSETDSGSLVPSPTVNDSRNGRNRTANRSQGKEHHHPGTTLCDYVMMWPTPTSTDGTHGGRITARKGRKGGSLVEAVSLSQFPTPTANRRSGLQSHGKNALLGTLNPMWVEWLMGWPIGWTALEPLAMDKFQAWLHAHGKS